jgi:hypothetical protein
MSGVSTTQPVVNESYAHEGGNIFVAMTGRRARMFPTERSAAGVSELQLIVRDTPLLQPLVQALPA